MMRRLLLPVLAGWMGSASAADLPVPSMTWDKDMLQVTAAGLPGKSIEIWYLEAYCRPGAHTQDWNKTVIGHTTTLVERTPDGRRLVLRCEVADGVRVEHTLTASPGAIDFYIVARNPTKKRSEVHWAQPCIRVGPFTGTQQDPDKYAYVPKCFVHVDGKRAFLPTEPWETEAKYTPGQVWRAPGVPAADVNPRPLNPVVPSNGLIGCVSADKSWTLGITFDPWHELFQGVIRCIHNDFRIGGLEPGESKIVTGRLYLQPGTPDDVLKRYRADFGSGDR